MKRVLTAAIAAVTFCTLSMLSSAASAQGGPFDRWSVGFDWINPGRSLVISGAGWAGHATGNLVGACAGKGFQYGSFYIGADLCVDGGVIETQERGYAGINGLGYVTLRTGWVFNLFGIPTLAYVGAGPDVGLASYGVDAAHLNKQWFSGQHAGFGLEAMFGHLSLDANVMRRRVSDIQDRNVGDATYGGLRIKYNF